MCKVDGNIVTIQGRSLRKGKTEIKFEKVIFNGLVVLVVFSPYTEGLDFEKVEEMARECLDIAYQQIERRKNEEDKKGVPEQSSLFYRGIGGGADGTGTVMFESNVT